MIRSAFTLRLEPGALAKYREYHDNIWPDLVAEIERCGIGTMSAFIADSLVFYYSEIRDEDSWDQLWSTPTHDRWGELMKPLIAFTDEGKVDATDLTEIFRRENSTEPTPLRLAYSLRLEPGALAQYKAQHDAIWPELVEVMDECGIAAADGLRCGSDRLLLRRASRGGFLRPVPPIGGHRPLGSDVRGPDRVHRRRPGRPAVHGRDLPSRHGTRVTEPSVAIVTGGTRGVGAAIAHALAAEGHTVVRRRSVGRAVRDRRQRSGQRRGAPCLGRA